VKPLLPIADCGLRLPAEAPAQAGNAELRLVEETVLKIFKAKYFVFSFRSLFSITILILFFTPQSLRARGLSEPEAEFRNPKSQNAHLSCIIHNADRFCLPAS
jgi:hypothetical protein